MSANDGNATNFSLTSSSPLSESKGGETIDDPHTLEKATNREDVEGSVVSGTTPFQTFLSLFKGNVGPGCLSLPWAYSILGLPLGCITTALVTIVVTFNAWTLVRLKRKYFPGKKSATYSVSFYILLEYLSLFTP